MDKIFRLLRKIPEAAENMTHILLGLRRHHLLIFLMLFLILSLFISFIEIAGEVREKETQALDELILMGLREKGDLSDPLGPEWFEELARDITALGGIGILAIFTSMAAGYLFIERKTRTAILLFFSIAGGGLLSYILKTGFGRPRPSLVPHEVYVYTSSFPSGHAMLSAITYLTIAALLAQVHERFGIKVYILSVAGFLVILIGMSRIYLGVHWPTDVLAGWLVGSAWALIVLLVARATGKGKSI
jgi:undecaprenyl-diphosphatase